MADKMTLKRGVVMGHVSHFKVSGPNDISGTV